MKMSLVLLLTVMFFAASAQQYKVEGNEVKVGGDIIFNTGTSKLNTAQSDSALLAIKKYLDDKSYITLLRVEGHVANAKEENNQLLNEQRAITICKRLVELGVDCKRLIAVGFGSQKPVAANDTADGKSKNTRITFVNVSLRGRVIGGMPVDGGGKVAGQICE